MIIKKNQSLLKLNSFKIDVYAKEYVEITCESEILEIYRQHRKKNILFIGGGSNILFTKNFNGLVVHLNIKGKNYKKINDKYVMVSASSGENWNDLVNWCVNRDFGGIENLSLIPGNVGGAPVQNIGAYGRELKDVLVSCRVYNWENGSFCEYECSKCDFDYRNSIFKKNKNLLITKVNLKLTSKNHLIISSYSGINEELKKLGVKNVSIKDISIAVSNIRSRKLPNLDKIGNAGSFFKNPIIEKNQLDFLVKNFENIPYYSVENNLFKIPAAWLIEKCGFKGKKFINFGVSKKQPLVLVNYGGANGKEILQLSKSIVSTVKKIFRINLETEVNII
tara:strand:+ start:3343 stop:4350 length:1008 start_codon:yes stop_codon:yes gene_type:complete